MREERTENNIDFGDMDQSFFLIGLISRFNNSLQAAADTLYEEISWKQTFFLNCIALFKEPPTIKEVAAVAGCSHQNAKQILLKLETVGFVDILQDGEDRRKQRIVLTDKAAEFAGKYNRSNEDVAKDLFAGVNGEAVATTIKVMTQLLNNLEKM